MNEANRVKKTKPFAMKPLLECLAKLRLKLPSMLLKHQHNLMKDIRVYGVDLLKRTHLLANKSDELAGATISELYSLPITEESRRNLKRTRICGNAAGCSVWTAAQRREPLRNRIDRFNNRPIDFV